MEFKIDIKTLAVVFSLGLVWSMMIFGIVDMDLITALNSVSFLTWFWVFVVAGLLDLGACVIVLLVILLIGAIASR